MILKRFEIGSSVRINNLTGWQSHDGLAFEQSDSEIEGTVITGIEAPAGDANGVALHLINNTGKPLAFAPSSEDSDEANRIVTGDGSVRELGPSLPLVVYYNGTDGHWLFP